MSSFFDEHYPFIGLRLIGLSVDKRAFVLTLEYYCEDKRTYEHNRQTYVWQTIANCYGTECFQLVSFYVLVMFKFTHCWPYFMSILVMKFTELSKRVQRHFSKYWNLIKQSAKHTHTHSHTPTQLQRGKKRACERGRRPAKGQQHWTQTHTLRPPQQTPVTGAGVLLPAGWHPLLYKGHTMPHTHTCTRVCVCACVCLAKSTINWIDFILQIALNFVVQSAAIDGEASGNNNELTSLRVQGKQRYTER